MNINLLKRLEKLELMQPDAATGWLIVSTAELIPAGFNGRAIVTGVPRHGEGMEAA